MHTWVVVARIRAAFSQYNVTFLAGVSIMTGTTVLANTVNAFTLIAGIRLAIIDICQTIVAGEAVGTRAPISRHVIFAMKSITNTRVWVAIINVQRTISTGITLSANTRVHVDIVAAFGVVNTGIGLTLIDIMFTFLSKQPIRTHAAVRVGSVLTQRVTWTWIRCAMSVFNFRFTIPSSVANVTNARVRKNIVDAFQRATWARVAFVDLGTRCAIVAIATMTFVRIQTIHTVFMFSTRIRTTLIGGLN